MSDHQAVEFYSSLRKDGDALARLAAAANEAELIELILDEAQGRNLKLDAKQVKAGLADLGSLIGNATRGEELQDFELELVSGGIESAREQWERAKMANGACR
ncbi:hypothetical protein HT585_27235 [Ensifer sp. HO-A22]|uniref:Nif11 domain-containing protein n=1 Tax=Ensifer oleiphilus TaxID=2742698 RepID=A0A7Y6UQJ5_9HYPH|nr:hypothetical protein [Ensifer oleiphilus]NVD42570.1 hypothetical protein [Ensifer oleiphilus]